MEADLVPENTLVTTTLDAHIVLKAVPKRYKKVSFKDKPIVDKDKYLKYRWNSLKVNAHLTDKKAGIPKRPVVNFAQFKAFFIKEAENLALSQSCQTNSEKRDWASISTGFWVSRIDKNKSYSYENLVLCKPCQCSQRYDPKSAKLRRNHYVEYQGVLLHIRRVWQMVKSTQGFTSYSGFFAHAKRNNFNMSVTLTRHNELAFKRSKLATTTTTLDSTNVKVAMCYVHNTATPLSDTSKIVRNSLPNYK